MVHMADTINTLTLGDTTITLDDPVNSPKHYNQAGIECIDAIRAATDDGFEYYLQGNIMKYLWRYEYKNNPLEDVRKGLWFLHKLEEELNGANNN